jgi:hypothetical protein
VALPGLIPELKLEHRPEDKPLIEDLEGFLHRTLEPRLNRKRERSAFFERFQREGMSLANLAEDKDEEALWEGRWPGRGEAGGLLEGERNNGVRSLTNIHAPKKTGRLCRHLGHGLLYSPSPLVVFVVCLVVDILVGVLAYIKGGSWLRFLLLSAFLSALIGFVVAVVLYLIRTIERRRLRLGYATDKCGLDK